MSGTRLRVIRLPRWGRVVVYAALAALSAGCVPVGARWQNMFLLLGLLG